MKVILSGQLNNAFTGRINRHFEPERWVPRGDGDYYASLFRHTDPSYFDRAATLVTIAEETLFGFIDWGVPSVSERGFGVSHQSYEDGEFQGQVLDGSEALSKALLEGHALSQASLEVLGRGGTEPHTLRSVGDERSYREQQLREMIQATVLASDGSAYLAIGEDEERILREIADFVSTGLINLPFAFPDMARVRFVTDETLPAALVNYSPPDPACIPATREDRLVRRYSASVASALAEAGVFERKRMLISAMREAAADELRLKGSEKVLEIVTAIVGAVGVPGIKLAIGAVKKRVVAGREEASWHLMRVRMSEVSLREYLNRTGNY